jgi:hypothetical protein
MLLSTNSLRIEFHKQTTPAVVPDIKQLLEATPWKRGWGEEATSRFLKWRYCDLDGGELMLAYDGHRPVAMIASYTRPYLIENRVVRLREAADWFCLPEYRQFGLGVQLMCNLMDEREPLLVIGGNENAQAVLPALGWRRLPDVRDYTLPLTGRWILDKLREKFRIPMPGAAVARSFAAARLPPWPRLRRRKRLNLTWRCLASSEGLPAMAPPASMYEVMPLIRENEVKWLHAAPKEMGTFFCLVFPENKGPAGFSIGRVFPYRNSHYMKLIHIQTSTPTVEVYGAMLAETIRYACQRGADVALFRASCPILRRALRAFGAVWSSPNRTYWWAKNGDSPGGNLHLTFLRGDDGIRP